MGLGLGLRSKFYRTREFMALCQKSAVYYSQEIRYFLKAKKSYLRTGLADADYKAMLIRKRTHHLERVLWHPKAYSDGIGEIAFRDLEALVDHPDRNVIARQEGWARRIMREYQRGDEGKGTFCPVIINEVPRPEAPLDSITLLKLLKMRRSRRVFENVPLTDYEKTMITEAAQHAPSSCNRQTLELIFVEDQSLKDFVASTIPGGYQFFAGAPAIAILLSDARDYKFPEDRAVPFIDAAAAVQNIYLLCETMGLGCCWGSYTSFGNIHREDEVRKRLGIPDSHLICASLAIGKSKQHVCEIPREPADLRFGVNGFRKKP